MGPRTAAPHSRTETSAAVHSGRRRRTASREVTDHQGRAMGSRLHIVLVTDSGRRRDPASIVTACVGEVERLEALWSRFRPSSELSVLNRSVGPQPVSPETRELVSRAVQAWHRTGGRFDPTVYDAMIRSGYANDFDSIAPGSARLDARPDDPDDPEDDHRDHIGGTARPSAPSRCGAIAIDHQLGTIELPPGTAIDPGGIGKGLAADRVADLARRLGAIGAMVNLGGDVRCRGTAPTADGWVIGARTGPGFPAVTLAIDEGGVATSTCRRRRWSNGDSPVHHLIDPGLGRSRDDAADQVTVVAATAAEAETTATALAAGDPIGRLSAGEVESMLGPAGALVVDHLGAVHRLGSIDQVIR